MRVQIPINHASYLLLTTFSITIENFLALFLGRVGLFIIPPLYSFQIFLGKSGTGEVGKKLRDVEEGWMKERGL